MSISKRRVRQIIREEAARSLNEAPGNPLRAGNPYRTGEDWRYKESEPYWERGQYGLQYMGGKYSGGPAEAFDRFNSALVKLADYANEEAPDDEADGEMLSVYDAAMLQVRHHLGTAAGRED